MDILKSFLPSRSSDELLLTITFRLRHSTSWAEAIHEVAWYQTKIAPSNLLNVPRKINAASYNVRLHTSKLQYSVQIAHSTISVDRVRGYLTSWNVNGHQVMESDPLTSVALMPSFWRAPTDNDIPIDLPYWQRFGLDALTSQLRYCSIDQDPTTSTVTIKTHTFLAPPILAWGFNVYTTYTISPSGSLSVQLKICPTGAYPSILPRMGLNIRLAKRLDTATWLGLGPGESYPDKKSSQALGIYTLPIEDLQTPYEVPQENGNRVQTRWVELRDTIGSGISAKSTKSENLLSWAAGRYSAEELMKAKHPCDLVEQDATLWRVDHEVAGVRTAACGPGVREEYRVLCREVEFGFLFETV